MKKGLLVVWMVMSCLISASWGADLADSGKVVVYYFHTNFRCPSCHKIENYTKEAVEKYFSEDLESGRLIFLPINTDKEGHQHFISDYQLYTKSVVLSLTKDGKEVKYDNLPKVWEYLRDKEKFYDYIKTETVKYLSEAR